MSSRTILLLDPSVLSSNSGDDIISESVLLEIENLFPHHKLLRGYTQDYPSKTLLNAANTADLVLVGGTNLLSSDFSLYKQWKVGWRHVPYLRNTVLMGVGWWQYQPSISTRTSLLYRMLLSSSCFHSVRDSYTQAKLDSIGISSINTGCPTIWRLSNTTTYHERTERVITTLTDYNQNPSLDRQILLMLVSFYKHVHFWPQGAGDLEYFLGLNTTGISVLPSSLKAFDNMMASQKNIEYCGTRLHAGIRALQHGRRSLIIAIDNRAKEMSLDFGLPVHDREDLTGLRFLICQPQSLSLKIPFSNIKAWKKSMLNNISLRPHHSKSSANDFDNTFFP